LVYFLSFIVLFYFTGCRSYLKTNSIQSDFSEQLELMGKMEKFFIVHQGDRMYELFDISADSTYLGGMLTVPSKTIYYYGEEKTSYSKEEKDILQEVHLYLNENSMPLSQGRVQIPFSEMKEIRMIEVNTGKTTFVHVLGALGISAGIAVVGIILIALTKSSCPYVYAYDGQGFRFVGETFGGAIGSNLERDDYMPLPGIQAVDGTYRVRISNELKERQYTDLAELLVVNHRPEEKVLLDEMGQVQVLQDLQAPVQALAPSGLDVQQVLLARDSSFFFFNVENQKQSQNAVELQFIKPDRVSSASLVLNAKNSLWLDFLFGEFLEKMGADYPEYMEKQSKISRTERLQRMYDADFPLSIYLKQGGEWKLIDQLMTVGPLAARDMVVPIDLSQHTGEQVEIKLETGFMFWELDYAGMDFGAVASAEPQTISPEYAIGTGDLDWTASLTKVDGQYMAQETVGDFTELWFTAPPVPAGQMQSVFLHTRGYYELIRDFEGRPEIMALRRFKKPGYFSVYSRMRFQEERAKLMVEGNGSQINR
jgi:hypothetical protein